MSINILEIIDPEGGHTLRTKGDAIHIVEARSCVALGCYETGVLVEFHTRPARSDPILTNVTLRWRCRSLHAWEETYVHDGTATRIDVEQVR